MTRLKCFFDARREYATQNCGNKCTIIVSNRMEAANEPEKIKETVNIDFHLCCLDTQKRKFL